MHLRSVFILTILSTPPLPLNFVFPPPPPKTLSFPAYHLTCLKKRMISDSLTVGSSWNLNTRFGTHFRTFLPLWITKNVGAERNTLCIIAFSFPAETQNCFSKTMIPDSLTVGLSWHFDIWFEIHFFTSSPLGFSKYCLWREKYTSHVDNGMEASIHSLLSNTWNYKSNQRKNLRNLRKPLEMLLLLSQYTCGPA